ncbi:hypothetical protein O6H91_23G038600 [Diphasiastrum complanatum]|nr:hypothetical protein O6H91_23G038600 [Diphasiastrum complanatum]
MGSSGSPCAGCKILRRKCTAECVLAPYFPPDQPQKFVCVHKMFGASNVAKILRELPLHYREATVNSLAYEADARRKDPVHGCVGAISRLQRQIAQLQQQLANAKADLAQYTARAVTEYGVLTPFQGSSSFLGMGTVEASCESTGQEQSADVLIDQQASREQILEITKLGGGSVRFAGRLGPTAPFLSHRFMNGLDSENGGVSEGLGI